MKQGHFYFISDKYYIDYDSEKKLMQNKESVDGVLHERPCFFAFNDVKNPDVYWCIPISSKVAKYESIVNHKLEKQQMRGVKNPYCNTICFSDVMGRKRAFLIQNIFPVTAKYIESHYINKETGTEVRIADVAEAHIIKNADEVLKLAFRGIPVLFTDVVTIYKNLVQQLDLEKQNKIKIVDPQPHNKPSVMDRLEVAKAQVAARAAEQPPDTRPAHSNEPHR